jgi:hypothetical protein
LSAGNGVLAGRTYFCFKWARVRLLEGGAGLAAALARSEDRNPGTNPIRPRTSIRSNARVDLFIGANSVSLRPSHRFSETSPLRMTPSAGQSASGAQVARRPLPEEPIGEKLQTIKDQRLSPARIKQGGKVPIGELRNKLAGAAPRTGRLPEDGKGFQGVERWHGYATYV